MKLDSRKKGCDGEKKKIIEEIMLKNSKFNGNFNNRSKKLNKLQEE